MHLCSCSFDYENVASEGANAMMAHLNSFIERDVAELDAELKSDEFQVAKVDQFSYTDPVDGSVSSKQVCQHFSCHLDSVLGF
jgi:phosphoglucomutase